MVEMALRTETKTTDHKVRWDTEIEGTRFSLYIPKWRVPEPWPQRIHVTISPYTQQQLCSLLPAIALQAPESRDEPIVSHIKKFREQTQTIRYQPEGESSTWEIGEPYIPTPMTYGGAERLTIIVKWL